MQWLPWCPGRARSRSRSPHRGEAGSKFTCSFCIGIEAGGEFRVGRRIIGAKGAKMKDIVRKAGGDTKLRLRGKGSGFREHDTEEESTEPLQLCISCPRQEGYNTAIRCAEALLCEIYAEYDRWCQDKGLEQRSPQIRMKERTHHGDGGGGGPRPAAKAAAKPKAKAATKRGRLRGKGERRRQQQSGKGDEGKGEGGKGEASERPEGPEGGVDQAALTDERSEGHGEAAAPDVDEEALSGDASPKAGGAGEEDSDGPPTT